MRFDKKWIQVLGLAISFPSLILATAYGFHLLVEEKILSPLVGWGLFVIILLNFLFILVRLAFTKKK